MEEATAWREKLYLLVGVDTVRYLPRSCWEIVPSSMASTALPGLGGTADVSSLCYFHLCSALVPAFVNQRGCDSI